MSIVMPARQLIAVCLVLVAYVFGREIRPLYGPLRRTLVVVGSSLLAACLITESYRATLEVWLLAGIAMAVGAFYRRRRDD